jgi:hypothetical protein
LVLVCLFSFGWFLVFCFLSGNRKQKLFSKVQIGPKKAYHHPKEQKKTSRATLGTFFGRPTVMTSIVRSDEFSPEKFRAHHNLSHHPGDLDALPVESRAPGRHTCVRWCRGRARVAQADVAGHLRWPEPALPAHSRDRANRCVDSARSFHSTRSHNESVRGGRVPHQHPS